MPVLPTSPGRPGRARAAIAFAAAALLGAAVLPAVTAGAAEAPVVRDDPVSVAIGTTAHFAAPGLRANDDALGSLHVHALSNIGYSYAHFANEQSLSDDGSFDIVVTGAATPGATYGIPYCFGPTSEPYSACTSNVAEVKVTAVAPVVRDDPVSVRIGTTAHFAAPGLRANDDPLGSLHVHALSNIGYSYAHFANEQSLSDDGSFDIVVTGAATPGATYSVPYCFGPTSEPYSACASNYGEVKVTAVAPVVRDDPVSVTIGTTKHFAAPGLLANDDPLGSLHVHALSNIGYSYAHFANEQSLSDDGSFDIVVTSAATVGSTYSIPYCFGATSEPYSACASNYGEVEVTVLAPIPPPVITSASSTSFVVGKPGTFAVTATGTPAPTLSLVGAPAWVHLTPTGSGTATLTGTPPAGSVASSPFHFTVRAHIDGAPDTDQAFALTVAKAATTTSVSSPPAGFGSALTLNAAVTTIAGETLVPTGTVTFSLDGAVVGTRPISGSGQASLTLPSGVGPGQHTVAASYGGDASFLGSSGSGTASLGCTSRMTGYVGSLTISSGSVCIDRAQVLGTITVTGSGAVAVTSSAVRGSIVDSSGGALMVCGSNISGDVSAQNAGGFVLIGDPSGHACTANNVGGSIIALNNAHGLVIVGNHYGQNLTVSGNSGAGPLPGDTGPKVSGNTKV